VPKLTAGEIAQLIGGRLVGSPDIVISRLSSLKSARQGDLSFLADKRHVKYAHNTLASAVFVSEEGVDWLPGSITKIICQNPYLAFARTIDSLVPSEEDELTGVAKSAAVSHTVVLGTDVLIAEGVCIGDSAKIGDRVKIFPGAYIGPGVVIGRDSIVYPRAVIHKNVKVGRRCIIHSGSIIGGDGFGFVKDEDGHWTKVRQIGSVVIGDDVEIGSNTTVDRGALDDTVIGNGVKVDNQVQIGHNCSIGDGTIIAGCVGIAGSVTLGKSCRIGGAAMFTGHLTVTDFVDISAGSLVSKDILRAGRYTGVHPLSTHEAWLKNSSLIRRLADLYGRVKRIDKTD